MVRSQTLGVKQIPELQHHKGGEEQGQFVYIHDASLPPALTPEQEAKHDDEEHGTTEQDTGTQRIGDDECRRATGLLLHHLARGG